MPAANMSLNAQNYLRRNFWVFHLILIGISCYLAAGIVTELLAARLLSPGEETLEASVFLDVSSSRPIKPDSGVFIASTLSGHNIFDAEPVPVENESLSDLGSGSPLSELGVELLGTLVATEREWSLATIRMQNASKLVQEGVVLAERATVTHIALRHIVLEDGPQSLVIPLWSEDPGAKGVPRRPPGPISPPPKKVVSNEFEKGVKKTGNYEWQLDRNMLNENLQDLTKIGMQARIVPNYDAGKYSGFRLVGITPDSLYKAIGLESGDLIRRVGGKDLDSPNKAIELFDQLRNSSSITLDIERRGQKLSMQYQIK